MVNSSQTNSDWSVSMGTQVRLNQTGQFLWETQVRLTQEWSVSMGN